MVECTICLGEYKEGDLELHRTVCVVLVMFRCSLCSEDYVSKEGLWNHLDLHEIEDESRELHCQEINAKHKLHQCALCNDLRAYSESSYWTHVHDVHDGFFRRYSECGEKIHSEEPKNNHALSNCKASENMTSHLELSRGEQRSIANERLDNELIEHSADSMNTASDLDSSGINKDPELLTINLTKSKESQSQITCDICGATCSSKHFLIRHKIQEHTKRYECAKCLKKFIYHSIYKCHSNACNPVQSDISSDKSSDEVLLKDRDDINLAAETPSSKASCIKCSDCGIEASSFDTLARHILVYHDPVACDFCGITLTNLFQAQHHKETMHKKLKLICPHCSLRCSCNTQFQAHVARCAKFPCEWCGNMFASEVAARSHRIDCCQIYKWKHEKEQKNAGTNLNYEADFSSAMEIISSPIDESGLSHTKCYFCNEEFSRPGYLIHHLKKCHELTRCDICGITVIGISGAKKSKIKCHSEAKYESQTWLLCARERYLCQLCGRTLKNITSAKEHNKRLHPNESSMDTFQLVQDQKQLKNECPICGKKIHNQRKYDAHCFLCAGKRYLCTLCGSTFKEILTVKQHNKLVHPNESSSKHIQIVQDQNHVQNNDLRMEITAEKTTISGCDDQGQSTLNPSSKVDVTNSRSNKHSSTNMNDDDFMDSQMIDQESRMVSMVSLEASRF